MYNNHLFLSKDLFGAPSLKTKVSDPENPSSLHILTSSSCSGLLGKMRTGDTGAAGLIPAAGYFGLSLGTTVYFSLPSASDGT